MREKIIAGQAVAYEYIQETTSMKRYYLMPENPVVSLSGVSIDLILTERIFSRPADLKKLILLNK